MRTSRIKLSVRFREFFPLRFIHTWCSTLRARNWLLTSSRHSYEQAASIVRCTEVVGLKWALGYSSVSIAILNNRTGTQSPPHGWKQDRRTVRSSWSLLCRSRSSPGAYSSTSARSARRRHVVVRTAHSFTFYVIYGDPRIFEFRTPPKSIETQG